MNRLTVILITTLSSLLLLSCAKESEVYLCPEGEMKDVVISCESGGSDGLVKGVNEYWENNISYLQVMVFSPRDSSIVSYGKAKGSSLTMRLCAGWEYIIYGIANSANDFSNVTSIEELKKMTTRMENQRKNYLEMIGQTGVIMVDPSKRIVLNMERVVAKLQINRLSVTLDCDECCKRSFDIDWVCITAVPTECNYDFVPVNASWKTSGIVTSNDMDIAFARVEDETIIMSEWIHSAYYSVDMYTLPDKVGKYSLARYLAIKAFGIGADDKECWHCIRFKLPSMEHNKKYVISNIVLEDLAKCSHDINTFKSLETRSAVSHQDAVFYDARADYSVEVSDMTTGEVIDRYEAHY